MNRRLRRRGEACRARTDAGTTADVPSPRRGHGSNTKRTCTEKIQRESGLAALCAGALFPHPIDQPVLNPRAATVCSELHLWPRAAAVSARYTSVRSAHAARDSRQLRLLSSASHMHASFPLPSIVCTAAKVQCYLINPFRRNHMPRASCRRCNRTWVSARAQPAFPQRCKKCPDWLWPVKMWQNASWGIDAARRATRHPKRPHPANLCGACLAGCCY